MWCALIRVTLLCMWPVRDMLFITHESPVTVLAVSVRQHMSIISQHGVSALMAAASEGHAEVVTQLLEAGANTDLLSTKVHNTCTVQRQLNKSTRGTRERLTWNMLGTHEDPQGICEGHARDTQAICV